MERSRGQLGVGRGRVRAGAPSAEMGGEVGAKITRIVANPVDEARFPAPQERQAEEI